MIGGKLDESRLEDKQFYMFMTGDRVVRTVYDRKADALVPALVVGERNVAPADSVPQFNLNRSRQDARAPSRFPPCAPLAGQCAGARGRRRSSARSRD